MYVCRLADPDQCWRLSTDGGAESLWLSGGRELVYRNGGRLMLVNLELGPDHAGSHGRYSRVATCPAR